MSEQLTMFESFDRSGRAPAPPMSRFDQWKQFHRENRGVWELFQRFADQARKAGRRRVGARMIGERIRWHTNIETTDAEFKVNDHHWPYYARLLVGLDQRFGEMFEFRDGHFDTTVDAIVAFHQSLAA